MSQHRLVVLRGLRDELYLPIWVGQFESDAITVALKDMEQERPMTHDLLQSIIQQMGGELRYVYINNLRKDVFFALIVIDVGGETIEIDARPSDAIALSVRTRTPIFVDGTVMDKAGIRPDRNVEPEILALPDDMLGEGEAIDESKLTAFADFVATLDLEDLEDKD